MFKSKSVFFITFSYFFACDTLIVIRIEICVCHSFSVNLELSVLVRSFDTAFRREYKNLIEVDLALDIHVVGKAIDKIYETTLNTPSQVIRQ